MKTTIYQSTGSSVQAQAAQREDGQWFQRIRERNRWGWHWTAWRALPYAPKMGWGEGGFVAQQEPRCVRLPK